MRTDIVVDVGNTRIKWGRCSPDAVVDSASLPPDDPAAWQEQLRRWQLAGPLAWVVAGVHPARRDRVADWLQEGGHTVRVLDDWRLLPVRTLVEHPRKVGIDRLLNVVAAKSKVQREVPLILISAGTAVVVDWVEEKGAFCGGAILPGFRLMAQALHDHTALLPRLEQPWTNPPVPGTSTPAAMQAGIFWAVAGGVRALIRQLTAQMASRHPCEIFLTGGDAPLLAPVLEQSVHLWPEMTLEGIRLTAETLP